ncbi:hypothetical protein SAPIO_CDS9727 [Scedosporium apiospermum]|uniref:Uncharacterized protein n=1 Tax=Pseudallescheria apiosperma TaxID=563466 RepID=A0A084FXF4_PSEDA|nr:uncharacterized protein SAPIO_CDS9727 [Scedosporium apiospermum]KEZ39766.1 hypothetical protein SAPIO_CDS9727 [Scedosporium apiospermum]
MRGYFASSDYNAGSTSTVGTGISFLFVVNRLDITSTQPHPDAWGNVIPPKDSNGFADEKESVVMRYMDGRVTPASGYRWDREGGWGTAGSIVGTRRTTKYKEQTVFSCNPHLPIVVGNFDPTVEVSDRDIDARKWHLLHFKCRPEFPATSFANGNAEGSTYVVGSNPTWMPSLVPHTFRNRSQYRLQQSRGLSGDVPLVLGLMAFWDDWWDNHQVRMQNTFYGHDSHWRDGVWTRRDEPRGYPTIEETPRGFLVHVSLDDYENPYSTKEALRRLEREHPIVPDISGDVSGHYPYH